MDQDATMLSTEVGLGLRDIVLDGEPGPPPLKGHSPQLSASVRCGQTAGSTKMPLGMEVDLGPGDSVFQYLVHVYFDQTAGWIKIPLGTEVNPGTGDVVLDGVAVPCP